MPDLGATERIVANRLQDDLTQAIKETKQMYEFLDRLNDLDLELLVVDPLVKPILETLLFFVENVKRELQGGNVAASLLEMILSKREGT